MAEQTEKAFLKQPGVFLSSKKTGKGKRPGKGGNRYFKSIGLGFKTPREATEGTYIDKKCPFTGNVSIRGRILAGTCHSAKMNRTIIIRRNYLHYVKKYQRQGLSLILFLVASLLLLLFLTRKLFQIREEALKYPSSHITMLPCERGRSCYYWTVQAFIQNCEVQCLKACKLGFLFPISYPR
ncbi:hypothetical protein RDI58_016471 [Solanum bulbocastanum]|uniref:Small ribosomal subunit protein uS17 n=1 Tax=Solanum bulbocastanum TaxID=147425 RepID=A0AAN8YDS9_SOLBU